MKKIVLLLGLLILTTCAAMASESAPAAQINYQGKLTNATGVPVSDGAHGITFKFFQVETGGTSLWESAKSVQTAGGLFSTVISPVPGDLFRGTLGSGSDLWLEIMAGGSTLSPRTKVVGAPYSTVAGFALDLANNTITTAQIRDGAVTASKLAPGAITIPQGPGSGLHADLLDGLHATNFLRLNDDNITTGSLSIGGLLRPSIGQTMGLSFASGYGGDSGDGAWLRYYPSGRGATAMNLDLGLANDANDQLNLISPGGVYVSGDLTVTGALNATINPGAFDGRYLLKTGNDQIFNGDLINTSGANYRNPLAATMGCISSQLFSSRYYYGPDSTSDLYIGESNPVYIRGNVQTSLVYDLDDTSFYVDPNATSRVNDLTVAGSLTASVDGSSLTDGSVTSAKIADGTISLSDIGSNGAAVGQIIKRSSSGWVLASDSDTTYSAGAGLTLSGTVFSIPTGAISSGMIAANPSLSGSLSVSGGITASTGDATGGFIRVSDAGGFYDHNNGWLTAQVGSGLRVRDISNAAFAPLQAGTTSIYGDLTVMGTLNATLAADPRYLRNDLPATSTQVIFGDLDVRSGSAPGTSFLHPGATDARNWTAVASQVFCSPNYYGPNSTATITIGENNPVSIPGSLTAPALNDTTSGYYVDPGSTSVMSRIDANALYDRVNAGYYVDPDDISILNSVRADRFYSRQDPGNYFLDPDGTSYINEVQAYVFRDRNDPNNYYLDPAATSRLRNIRVGGYGGVTDDVQAGIMWNDTTDYGIYRESGAWTSPYPDLRIAFETGIKIGADSAYGGTRFFSGSDMATEIFSVGNGDANVRVNTALYSPITYDKDNVGYFVDPAGTSVINGLTVNGALTIPNGSIVSGKLSASGSTAGQVLTSNGTGVVWGSPSAGDGSAYDSRFVNSSGDTMTGNLITSGSLTATALYDSGSPLYYVNPDGISALNNVHGDRFSSRQDPSNYYLDLDNTSYVNEIEANRFSDKSDPVNYYLRPSATSLVNYIQANRFSDKSDPGVYYLDPSATSVVNNLVVNGTMSAPAGKPEPPIAYAYIELDGLKASGTSNVTSTWESAKSRYVIQIAGEDYNPAAYVTTVTVSGSTPCVAVTSSVGITDRSLVVQIYNLTGAKVQADFQFVVHKP